MNSAEFYKLLADLPPLDIGNDDSCKTALQKKALKDRAIQIAEADMAYEFALACEREQNALIDKDRDAALLTVLKILTGKATDEQVSALNKYYDDRAKAKDAHIQNLMIKVGTGVATNEEVREVNNYKEEKYMKTELDALQSKVDLEMATDEEKNAKTTIQKKYNELRHKIRMQDYAIYLKKRQSIDYAYDIIVILMNGIKD